MLVPRPRTQGAPIVVTTGATEDPVSGRAARPGDSAMSRQTLLNFPHGRGAPERWMPLRRSALRGDRAARERELLPLHALPEAHGHGSLGAGSHRPRLAQRPLGRGAPTRLRAGGRVSEGLLFRVRLRALGDA